MEKLATAIGLVAAFCTTTAWLPQVRKTLATRKARDFSWGYLAFFATGVASWLLYGILRRDPVIIAANVGTLLLVLVVALVKSRETE